MLSRPPIARLVVAFLALALTAAAATASPIRRLEFLGQATVPHGLMIEDTPVGGLSALTYDAERGVFYALCDELGQRAPSRFYTVKMTLDGGRLAENGVSIEDVTLLRGVDGRVLAPDTVDSEGLALWHGSGGRSLFLSSEGKIADGVAPLVAEIDLEGRIKRFLALPDRYLPAATGRGWLRRALRRGPSGLRHNLALESLTLSPSGRWLFTANENALQQDGDPATPEAGSPVRLSRLRMPDGAWQAEYLYLTEPVAKAPTEESGFATAGLVELLAFDDQRLLALERSYSAGAGNTIRLFEVDLEGAADVSAVRELGRRPDLRPVNKRLLLDLAELGVAIDNVEGLAFGPRLADGRGTLVLVSDDNFNPRQTTQFLAFAFSDEAPSIDEIQGRGHRSPLAGTWVFDGGGVVSAVAPASEDPEDGGELWIERLRDGGEAAGLRLTTARRGDVAAGDRIRFRGRVDEVGRPGDLPVTSLAGARIEILASPGDPPAPIRLGRGGRAIPSRHVDDDGLSRFEPEDDTIDYFELLEGVRVEIPEPLVVGPGNRWGECVVLADGGAGAEPRTGRGGVRLTSSDVNPERLTVSTRLIGERCAADVGERFDGPITGVLSYEFGTYRVLATEPLPATRPAVEIAEATPDEEPDGSAAGLSVATFNVENLDPEDGKTARLAAVIVGDLESPQVLALQEIQDDSGPTDDGTTTADANLAALVAAIVAAGGPRYDFHQIDPVDGADGGQPGGNIRVAFLVDPRRARVEKRGEPAARAGVEVRGDGDGPLIFPNPGLVAPDDPAFAEDEGRGYAATRKPLALEVEVGGRRVFFINVHLKSKSGDDAVFGARQPPWLVTEEQRSLQAARVREVADEILARDPRAAVVVLGDVNEHEFRGPLAVLTAGGLVNLVTRVPAAERYTYNYRGNSQVLDHILVSPSLADGATARILHLHADFAVPRATDHDPVLARLSVD